MTTEETFTPPDSPPTPANTGEAVKRLLASLLTSKKFVALLVGLLVTAMARRGIVLQPDMVTEVVGLFAVYIVGQGIADRGKEAAQIQSAFSWKDLGKIGVAVAPSVLPGKAGQIAGEVTGQGELADVKRRVAVIEARLGIR